MGVSVSEVTSPQMVVRGVTRQGERGWSKYLEDGVTSFMDVRMISCSFKPHGSSGGVDVIQSLCRFVVESFDLWVQYFDL